MKKLIIGLLLTLSTGLLFAQNINYFTSPSPQHVLLKGTKLYLIPPTNFVESKNFKGFQNPIDPTTMIMVTELPAPFPEIYKGFTVDNLKARGMDLVDKTDVLFNGKKAMLLTINQTANGNTFTKNIFAFGDLRSTTLINGVYLKGSRIAEDVLKSVKTAYVDTAIVSDPRAALDYQVDETLGNLKMVGVLGNGMMFKRDGKTPTQSEDKASVTTDKSYAKVKVGDKYAFAINRIKGIKKDTDTLTNVKTGEIEINGLKGWQILATNKKEAEDIYQVILYPEDGGYYLFVGTFVTGNTKAQEDIKKVIESFKRR